MKIRQLMFAIFILMVLVVLGCNKTQSDKSKTNEETEVQLNNRINYFIQLYGSKENLEKVTGKTTEQLKEEYRDIIRTQVNKEVNSN